MALTSDEKKKQDEIHERVIKLATVLLGTNGDDGMVGDVKRLAASHYRLKRNFWILVAFLGGSGVLGGSIWMAIGA